MSESTISPAESSGNHQTKDGAKASSVGTVDSQESASELLATRRDEPQQPKRLAKRPSKEIGTLEQFVYHAYLRKGQRVTLNKKAAKALSEGPMPSDDFLGRVAKLAEEDVLLAVPRQLLLAGLQHKSLVKLWSGIQRVVDRALESHPCTQGVVTRVTAPGEVGNDLDSFAESAMARDCSQIRMPGNGKALTKPQMMTLRMNVAYTSALWLVAKRGIEWQSVVRRLHSLLWETESDRVRSDVDRLRVVTDIRQVAGAGLLCEAFVADSNEQRATAEAATRREGVALGRISELQNEVSALNKRIETQDGNIKDLKDQLASAITEHNAKVIHLRDDFERLRTRVLRRLKSELELLDEGLHAIRRNPPKVQIMEDHADRAANGLRDEIKALQAEAGE